jgi:hypothetical protein
LRCATPALSCTRRHGRFGRFCPIESTKATHAWCEFFVSFNAQPTLRSALDAFFGRTRVTTVAEPVDATFKKADAPISERTPRSTTFILIRKRSQKFIQGLAALW